MIGDPETRNRKLFSEDLSPVSVLVPGERGAAETLGLAF